MIAYVIKSVILFWLSVGLTVVAFQARAEKEDTWTWLCAIIMFVLSLSQLFNLIDVAFA
jgi:heme/copper-type cytochrome/quinol oxidase subunit 4